jgi:hypothetical protein
VSCKLLIVLALVGIARRARAERPIHVDAAGAPFEARQLEAALRMRISPDGAAVRIRVTAIENGVRIESHGAVRDVPLSDLHGSDAARLVALAADDLLMADLAMPPPPVPVAPRASLGLLGGAAAWNGLAGGGAATSETLGGMALEVVVPRGAYVLAVEAGGGRLFGGGIDVTAGDVRASAGVRAGWLEARAGVTLVPMLVSTGAGDFTVLVGAGASARVHVPLGASLGAVLGGGADVFATQTQYRITGMPVLTTPRWSPWIALGIEVPL